MTNNNLVTTIEFGDRRIGAGHPVVIIAEIGVNHEGDFDVCKEMVMRATESGADAIKLQTIDADENYVRGTESYKLFSSCSLTADQTGQIFQLARNNGMEAFTTAGDFATLDWVEELSPAAHKISSGLFTHLPLVRHAAKTGRTLLMSTGAATIDQIDESVNFARRAGCREIGLFQCTSIYPAPPETLNLANLPWLADRYQLPTGYSDHTEGIAAAAYAVASGAVMIEKHFTLDKTRPGFDHRLSLMPADFKAMVKGIREVETMMGRPGKSLEGEELQKADELHRVLVAKRAIEKDEEFTEENLGAKRPLPQKLGLAPRYFDEILGKKATRRLQPDDPVTADVAGISNPGMGSDIDKKPTK